MRTKPIHRTSETYTIAADGKSITCLRCHQTSYHPADVDQRFCANCGRWHGDEEPTTSIELVIDAS